METENKQSLIEKVKGLNKKGKYEEVCNLLTEELLENYGNHELYAEIAQARYHLNRDNVKIYAEKSLKILKNAKGYLYLGLFYKKSKNNLKAEELLKKILEFEDYNFEAFIQLGNIYQDKKQIELAKEFYEKAIQIEPENYRIYNNLGNIYLKMGDFVLAQKYYEKAIQLKPNDTFVFNGYGALFYVMKEFEKAELNFRKSIEFSPDYCKPHHNLANVLYAQEKYLEAKVFYENSLKLREIKDIYYFVASARIEEINKILANEDYEKIQELVSKIKEVLEYKDKCITHFTSLSVTKHLIFEGSKFRLSEGAYLNDTSEGRELFTYLNYQSPFGKKENPVDEIFVQKPFIGSFVSEGKNNDLTMWRMYGKEGKNEAKGCAVTMNIEDLSEQIKEELGVNRLEASELEIKFYKVAYWKDKKFIIPDEKLSGVKIKNLNKFCLELKKVLEEFNAKDEEIRIQIDVEELLFEIAFLFKGIEYQYEHEVRLVQKGIGFEKIVDTNFKVPRVYIELADISSSISKVILGPKVKKADEWAAAFHYELKNKNVEAEVHISKQPFK